MLQNAEWYVYTVYEFPMQTARARSSARARTAKRNEALPPDGALDFARRCTLASVASFWLQE